MISLHLARPAGHNAAMHANFRRDREGFGAWSGVLAVVVAGGLAASCAAASSRGGASGGDPAESYNRDSRRLFDDGFDPEAFGLVMTEVTDPKRDPVLRARAENADAVLLVRATTVSSVPGDTEPTYVVVFRIDKVVRGSGAVGQTFPVEFGPSSRSYGLVRSGEGTLAGRTFLGFVKGFRGPDGGSDTHAHFAANNPMVAAAVDDAVLLEKLK